MKARFVQCELCKKEIPLESCELATYRTAIDGKEYIFCCEACAKSHREKRKEQRAKTRWFSRERPKGQDDLQRKRVALSDGQNW